ncbi:hypothetical protein DXN05_17355 [Deminuibacter soli]|uniref:Uncharacterized protein n=1 Tax=Deminuibacter soli TaxID=2291815 RepID=A0A3E1NFV6_9BACT|nr:hypothetical protein DXN05_17355 [Deminuibacter soli]
MLTTEQLKYNLTVYLDKGDKEEVIGFTFLVQEPGINTRYVCHIPPPGMAHLHCICTGLVNELCNTINKRRLIP